MVLLDADPQISLSRIFAQVFSDPEINISKSPWKIQIKQKINKNYKKSTNTSLIEMDWRTIPWSRVWEAVAIVIHHKHSQKTKQPISSHSNARSRKKQRITITDLIEIIQSKNWRKHDFKRNWRELKETKLVWDCVQQI